MRVTVLITLDQYVVSQVFDGYPANNSPSQHVGNLIYACKQAIPALYNGLRYRSPQTKLPYSHIHAKQRGPEPSLVAYRHHPTAHQFFKSHNVPVPFPTMHHFVNRNVHMCAHFYYNGMHCAIFIWCIVGFVRWLYCRLVWHTRAFCVIDHELDPSEDPQPHPTPPPNHRCEMKT